MSDKNIEKEKEQEELQENTANAGAEENLNQVDETAEATETAKEEGAAAELA